MGRRRFKRYLKWALWGGLGIAALLIAVVGPWPTYSSAWEGSTYLAVSLDFLSERRAVHEEATEKNSFRSGWKVVPIEPPEGTPLAGYGARKGASSKGMRHAIFVKALALSDGEDTAIVVGSDLLIVPENIADQVRETIADSTDLSGEEILFNASHNHSGPGGFAPGWVSGVFNGSYRPDFERHLVSVFVEAIEGALRNLEPSRLGGGWRRRTSSAIGSVPMPRSTAR